MSKKRGLSHEEKRKKLLELFYEKKEFFQLKELEKVAPKEKGITSMSVKEVLQSLVDDNLVDSDKIGTSIYFWAFPSKAVLARKSHLEALRANIQSSNEKMKESIEELARQKAGKDDTEERRSLLEEYLKVEQRNKELNATLGKYDDCNPQVLETMKKQITDYVQATNRWTDNIYTLDSYCKNKLGLETKDIHSFFGIPDDIDYI